MVNTRVKERLTGAIILVALLVLLVPELLTGPSRSAPASHPASLDGAQMRSYTIDLADDAAARHPASAPAAEIPSPAPKPTAESAPADADAAASESADARSSGTAQAESVGEKSLGEKSGGTAQAESTAPPVADTAEPSSPVPSGATARPASPAPGMATNDSTARPPPSAPRVATAESPPVTGWAIQVGSFASRENAERLARELKGKGFAAIVNQSSGNGKRLWRVRVGPEADRAAAVALGAKLRAAGRPGAIVPLP
jgi:DedD protein